MGPKVLRNMAGLVCGETETQRDMYALSFSVCTNWESRFQIFNSLSLAYGAFFNYVDQILPIIDHLSI